MCKFLVQAGQTVQKTSDLMSEKIQQVQVLEEENKALEEKMTKQIIERKSSGTSSKPSKLEDLLSKLKKLDDIAFGLEEKNMFNEKIIKKQNKMIVHLKEKCEKVTQENKELKEEKDKIEAKLKELEKYLSTEVDLSRETFRNCKNSEIETEDVELNQSISSESEQVLRKIMANDRKFRAQTMVPSMMNVSLERPNFRKMQSEIVHENEKISDFGSFLNSERKISLPMEESVFFKQLNEAKSNPKVFRRPFIYYHQIQLLKLQQNLGLGKFF